MRQGRACRWQRFLLLLGLLAVLAPGWAQTTKLPTEMVLNGVTINSTYIEVLARLGLPHWIGPSVSGIAGITGVLQPPGPKTETPATRPAFTNQGQPMAPRMAPMNPGMLPTGAEGLNTPAMQPEKVVGPFMVWRYDGAGKKPDPTAAYSTYVFFDDKGVVQAVVVNLNKREARPGIWTESKVGFGTALLDIVQMGYNWPEPLTRVGDLYFCSYPNNNVTFSVEATGRKVVCIGVGIPIAVTQVKLSSGGTGKANPSAGPQITLPGGIPGSGGLPGFGGMVPGMRGMPPGLSGGAIPNSLLKIGNSGYGPGN